MSFDFSDENRPQTTIGSITFLLDLLIELTTGCCFSNTSHHHVKELSMAFSKTGQQPRDDLRHMGWLDEMVTS